ncbi:UDP-2,3-diacylglucosamine diphosphatase [Idiomarina xiamenensis]|uniref:UDP-2,3-diacylglucosamine hydrolase n=1 Tax=Idiomarina xiamenensis 10-D-4 TaxID=740709 RepID=K2L1X9_9GAMM|nr:UDP-2,3-diacylglucosamine diphosphatase [Idiomarina xiamenensis]EKE83860.1 UDP-2,3-diacylglucosamine hydrolase [Idiomarina xiamenensis 10-D-4]
MTQLFISDLHLSPARPDICELFFEFLQGPAREAAALYILGDLFDAWIGDDDNSRFAAEVKQQLRQLTQAGVPSYFMAGNRDFMVGQRFAQQTGIHLLNDPTVIELYGQRTLLMHGDLLCTLDTGYQRFRRVIQHPLSKWLLARLPLSTRMRIANKLRANSQTQQPQLSDEQLRRMDVELTTVRHVMESHAVKYLIHGHTHRPGHHQFSLSDGSTAERWVLGDWYEQGSHLSVREEQFKLHSTALPPR